MFAPSWEVGCKHCSSWADNFERNIIHLTQRDVTLFAVFRAPLSQLDAFRSAWAGASSGCRSGRSDFNYDYHVSYTPDELAKGEVYRNYRLQKIAMTDVARISVFYKDPGGTVFHTYSSYERGLDMMNAAYHTWTWCPKGETKKGCRPGKPGCGTATGMAANHCEPADSPQARGTTQSSDADGLGYTFVCRELRAFRGRLPA